jgi:hypothetical protein
MGQGTEQVIPVFGGLTGAEDGATLNALRTDLLGSYGENLVWGDEAAIVKPKGTNSESPVDPGKSATNNKNGSLKMYAFLFVFPCVFGLYFHTLW